MEKKKKKKLQCPNQKVKLSITFQHKDNMGLILDHVIDVCSKKTDESYSAWIYNRILGFAAYQLSDDCKKNEPNLYADCDCPDCRKFISYINKNAKKIT